jgi:hypothetical protein
MARTRRLEYMLKLPSQSNEICRRMMVGQWVALASIAAGGCTSTSPIEAWQHEAERIILRDDRLDLDRLRLLPVKGSPTRLRPAQIVIGAPEAGGSGGLFGSVRREVRGALVEVFPFGSREWLVFLLGVVRNESSWRYNPNGLTVIETIRPVALALDGAETTWVVGPPDSEAKQRYGSPTSRASSEDGTRAPGRPRSFPGLIDAFQVVETPGGLDVCEIRTGACWALPLP